MSFNDRLTSLTAPDRAYLVNAPAITDGLAGQLSLERYLAFLTQAYHHVRHTVPLLMAAGARLEDRWPWLQERIVHYIEEETGHEQWILNDIEAAGGDRAAARESRPNIETDAMVAYAWDTVNRRNPIGLFGMVHVLEGTSVAVAVRAAEAIQNSLGLPDQALTYLTSHGQLDIEHLQQLRDILDRLTERVDQQAVTECARAMYWLYGQMFRGIDRGLSATSTLARSVA